MVEVTVLFRAKFTSGPLQGTVVDATQIINPLIAVEMKEVEAGDKILLGQSQVHNQTDQWVFTEYVRTDALIVLGVLYALCLLLFGGLRGLNTILSLMFTCLAIFMVLVPAILSGHNIYLWSIVTCVFIVSVTLIIVNGIGKKSLAAALGCLGGIVVAGAITLIMDGIIELTGFVDENSVYLVMLNPDHPIDLQAIIFASIIIGAIGAIMDVSVEIASSLKEIYEQSSQPGFAMLVKSGFNIGRDIMGTMANTLVLAYIGSSLAVVLLLTAYKSSSLLHLFNLEMIVVEVLQALIGSFGILLAIPLTSVISALLYTMHLPAAGTPEAVTTEAPRAARHYSDDPDVPQWKW